MSSDNAHFVVQLADGQWRASRNHSVSWWHERTAVAEYRVASSSTRKTDPVFDTAEEAAEYCDQEYSEYGTFRFERPEQLR